MNFLHARFSRRQNPPLASANADRRKSCVPAGFRAHAEFALSAGEWYCVLAESVRPSSYKPPGASGAQGNVNVPSYQSMFAGISDRRTVGSLRETIVSASVAAIAATTFQIVTGQTDCVRNIVL